jgi:hypothetical protein
VASSINGAFIIVDRLMRKFAEAAALDLRAIELG